MIVLAAAAANQEVSQLAERLGGLGKVVLLGPPPSTDHDVASIPADLSSADAVAVAWKVAEDSHGPADALVSVPPAAVAAAVPFAEVSHALWTSTLLDNLTPAMHVAREAARAMTARERGRIVLVTWQLDDPVGMVPLAAASGSIWQLAKALATEVGISGVTVNAVSVGPGRLSEAAAVILLLCSPEAGYLTAEVLRPAGNALAPWNLSP